MARQNMLRISRWMVLSYEGDGVRHSGEMEPRGIDRPLY
jgi:hypothetical protein